MPLFRLLTKYKKYKVNSFFCKRKKHDKINKAENILIIRKIVKVLCFLLW